MTARTAPGVGVRCRPAATAPKRIATICVRSAPDLHSRYFDDVGTRPRVHDGMKCIRRDITVKLRIVRALEVIQNSGGIRFASESDDASPEARTSQTRPERSPFARRVNHGVEARSTRAEIVAQAAMRGVHQRTDFLEPARPECHGSETDTLSLR